VVNVNIVANDHVPGNAHATLNDAVITDVDVAFEVGGALHFGVVSDFDKTFGKHVRLQDAILVGVYFQRPGNEFFPVIVVIFFFRFNQVFHKLIELVNVHPRVLHLQQPFFDGIDFSLVADNEQIHVIDIRYQCHDKTLLYVMSIA